MVWSPGHSFTALKSVCHLQNEGLDTFWFPNLEVSDALGVWSCMSCPRLRILMWRLWSLSGYEPLSKAVFRSPTNTTSRSLLEILFLLLEATVGGEGFSLYCDLCPLFSGQRLLRHRSQNSKHRYPASVLWSQSRYKFTKTALWSWHASSSQGPDK